MHYPSQRKLSKEAKEDTSQLISLKANKKLIQHKLVSETGRIVLLKDITNISTAIQKAKSRNNIDIVVKKLMEQHGNNVYMHTIIDTLYIGTSVDIYVDTEKNFKGIFMQDQLMLDAFKAYPEFICLDATYKLLELGLSVFVMVCEGQTEIIATCLLVSED